MIGRILRAALLAQLLVPSSEAQTILTFAGGGTPDGRPATAAGLSHPSDIAFDTAGNLYIADEGNNRVRRVAAGTGIISTVAGNGADGFSGDGGPATAAGTASPWGVTVDGFGNVYIADQASHRIRKVDAATGIISTVAGSGATDGPWGNGGPATAARLYFPTGVSLDSAGNLYIADSGHDVIRKVDHATGIITTAVGGYSGVGDGGPATLAGLEIPRSAVFDASGNLYIAEMDGQRVRRVDAATGIISTVAGSGVEGFSGDGGPATAAKLHDPFRIALDAAGTLYIADRLNNRVRKVDPSTGIISTVAGTGAEGFSGDGGPATLAKLHWPTGLTVDASGSLYIANYHHPAVRKVSATTGVISTVAGNGEAGFLGDGGPALASGLNEPRGIAIDSSGNLYIADSLNYRIRRVDAQTGTISTVAGTGLSGFSGDRGPATAATLYVPYGVGVDPSGDLYIADQRNNRIRKVTAVSGIITTVAGNGIDGFSGDGGQATSAKLSWPVAVAFDTVGNLFIADSRNRRVRKVDRSTGIISTVAGDGGEGGATGDGGPATAAGMASPGGLAVDASGNLYISDSGFHRIRKVAAGTGIITTVAGPGNIEFPQGMAVDVAGNLYFADDFDQRVRKLAAGSGSLSTLAGKGQVGLAQGVFSGDGGPAKEAGLDEPFGVAVDASGAVYIAEAASGRIRVVYACVTVNPAELAAPANGSSGVATSPRLAWNGVRGAFRYDVLFDTTNPPLKVAAADVTTLSFSPANLDPLTTYYWQVIAKGDPFCTPPSKASSEIRSFTTAGGCGGPQDFEGASP